MLTASLSPTNNLLQLLKIRQDLKLEVRQLSSAARLLNGVEMHEEHEADVQREKRRNEGQLDLLWRSNPRFAIVAKQVKVKTHKPTAVDNYFFLNAINPKTSKLAESLCSARVIIIAE